MCCRNIRCHHVILAAVLQWYSEFQEITAFSFLLSEVEGLRWSPQMLLVPPNCCFSYCYSSMAFKMIRERNKPEKHYLSAPLFLWVCFFYTLHTAVKIIHSFLKRSIWNRVSRTAVNYGACLNGTHCSALLRRMGSRGQISEMKEQCTWQVHALTSLIRWGEHQRLCWGLCVDASSRGTHRCKHQSAA